jgi:hypothetical protein
VNYIEKLEDIVDKAEGADMISIKEMPYRERYAIVLDKMKPNNVLISPFIQKHLGAKALEELQDIWQEGIKPVPEDASDEEKYEIAYSNLIWRGKSSLSFVRSHLGEDGIKQFKLAQVEELKRKNTGPALFMLGLLRAVSPGSAFIMTAKRMAYQMQWLTPLSLVELTRNRAVYDIPRCKVLDFPDAEDICLIDCQGAYPMWLAEQFKVGLKFERQGKDCTATLTHLDK